ncbi:MAG: carboxy terminal-processing peptidase [Victivallales bacterium]|nr:carboxy terminal-processing peptidase [Victivallales bacterium]
MKHESTFGGKKARLAMALSLLFLCIGLPRLMASGQPGAELQAKLDEVRGFHIERPTPSPGDALIARTVVQVALTQHYNYQSFTPMLSCQWFQAFFEMLDPTKVIFLQSDLDELQGTADTLYTPGSKNLRMGFPYQVYEKYLERYREYVLFWAEELYRDQDFTEEETLPLYARSEELQWPASVAQQHDLWRKMVKSALLGNALTREELEDGEDEAPRGKDDVRERTLRSMISMFMVRNEASSLDILEMYLNAFLGLFDPHTNYLAPETKEDFDISMSLSLQGIGATLSWQEGYTTVSSLVPGGPAARDGRLKPGDRIVAVAQDAEEEPLNVVGMKLSRVVQYIRGPKDTEVFLTVQPEGSSESVIYRLVRDEIVLTESEAQSFTYSFPVEGMERPARVVQLYLPSFYRDFNARDRGEKNYKSTTSDLRRLLREAMAAGPVDGVILDLRGNGGGSLDEAVALCGLFEGKVPVVQVRNQQGGVSVLRASRANPMYRGPLMVMVDRNSASASEIVAACLQDSERAVIVGDRSTHGKGTVQGLDELSTQPQLAKSMVTLGMKDPGTMKITIAKFYRINGGSTQERGVEPDIVFPSFLEHMETSEKTLPHCLPWDEINPVRYSRQTRLRSRLPELQAFAEEYMATNPDFVEFAREVEAYRQFREIRELPLEIQARRGYRERERRAARMIRRFRPRRGSDDEETAEVLKTDEERLLEREKLPEEDVVLDAALAILGRQIELNLESDHAFSVE